MIVVDTSALVAMLLNEPEARSFSDVIQTAGTAVVGAPSAFELQLVVQRRLGVGHQQAADILLDAPELEIVAWTPALVPIATEALRCFGGRPARLNFGDCMTYALARSLNAPLLYKGSDFARTDIRSAL